MAEHPQLVHDRLKAPGAWLRDKLGGALNGFFKKPYLLWFVAEDPVRNGKLPGNIAQVTRAIAENLAKWLDHTSLPGEAVLEIIRVEVNKHARAN